MFDAMGGMSRTTIRTTNAGAIDVVYCAAEEADSWIVQEVRRTGPKRWCHALCRRMYAYLLVAAQGVQNEVGMLGLLCEGRRSQPSRVCPRIM